MGRTIYSKRYDKLLRLIVGARRDAGLTQEQVARRLRRPQSFVSKCELGERRIDVIEFLDFAYSVGFDPGDVIRQLK